MLLFLGLFMICSFVKLCKESEVTHLFLTMQPNVFVCFSYFGRLQLLSHLAVNLSTSSSIMKANCT